MALTPEQQLGGKTLLAGLNTTLDSGARSAVHADNAASAFAQAERLNIDRKNLAETFAVNNLAAGVKAAQDFADLETQQASVGVKSYSTSLVRVQNAFRTIHALDTEIAAGNANRQSESIYQRQQDLIAQGKAYNKAAKKAHQNGLVKLAATVALAYATGGASLAFGTAAAGAVGAQASK